MNGTCITEFSPIISNGYYFSDHSKKDDLLMLSSF